MSVIFCHVGSSWFSFVPTFHVIQFWSNDNSYKQNKWTTEMWLLGAVGKMATSIKEPKVPLAFVLLLWKQVGNLCCRLWLIAMSRQTFNITTLFITNFTMVFFSGEKRKKLYVMKVLNVQCHIWMKLHVGKMCFII